MVGRIHLQHALLQDPLHLHAAAPARVGVLGAAVALPVTEAVHVASGVTGQVGLLDESQRAEVALVAVDPLMDARLVGLEHVLEGELGVAQVALERLLARVDALVDLEVGAAGVHLPAHAALVVGVPVHLAVHVVLGNGLEDLGALWASVVLAGAGRRVPGPGSEVGMDGAHVATQRTLLHKVLLADVALVLFGHVRPHVAAESWLLFERFHIYT